MIETLKDLLRDAYEEIAGVKTAATFTYRCSWSSESLGSRSVSEYADLLSDSLESARYADYEKKDDHRRTAS